MKLQQFIERYKVAFECKPADSNPNMRDDEKWNAEAHHFACALRCGRRRMAVPFSQGSAITRDPTAASVLDCLASDASTIENAGSFEEFARELGYDTDSRKAEKTYKTCQKQAAALKRLLGDEAYEQLLWHTDRE